MAKKNDQTSLIGTLDMEDQGVGIATKKERIRLEHPTRMVALRDILSASPTQTRMETFNPDKYEKDAELLESVRLNGVAQPVMVKQMPKYFGQEATYIQVFGHRRVAAARLAGLEYVPAIVAKSTADVATLTIIENTGTRELTGYERALALSVLKSTRSDLNGAGLAHVTGIPQPTVYSLLSALEKSPEALRGLFSAGLGMRTVQGLQPVFAAIESDRHKELATLLENVSYRQSESLNDAVKQGLNPIVIARSWGSAGKGSQSVASMVQKTVALSNPLAEEELPTREPIAEEPVEVDQVAQDLPVDNTYVKSEAEAPEKGAIVSQEDSISDEPDPSQNQSDQPHDSDSEYDLDNKEVVVATLSALSFATREQVEKLMASAVTSGDSMEDLTLACMYVGRGGDETKALELAARASSQKTVTTLIKKYRSTVSRAVPLLERLDKDDVNISDFVRTILFGGVNS